MARGYASPVVAKPFSRGEDNRALVLNALLDPSHGLSAAYEEAQ